MNLEQKTLEHRQKLLEEDQIESLTILYDKMVNLNRELKSIEEQKEQIKNWTLEETTQSTRQYSVKRSRDCC